MWYHGTNIKNYNNIVQHGFKLNNEIGIWGNGIYFTQSLDEAAEYGESVLFANIEPSEVMVLDYLKDVSKLFNDLSLDDEEGTPLMKDYITSLDKKAVVIKYSENDVNLIVYNPTIISVLN